ncbi:Ig-like domain-containing protein [Flavobacterium sp.]|uniref:Ig-like domain-containing protein n=1 Tax=Flavobacterium sp. TaxID=239 RepID=UPI003C3D31AA
MKPHFNQPKKKWLLKIIPLVVFLSVLNSNSTIAQINVDINLNMKHSVDNVSDFGRERHMTIHSSPTESDWNGEETKLDYLINDLGVYFGRETGSATWKNQLVEQDPNHAGWPNEAQMTTVANGLKTWADGPDFSTRRQYRAKEKNMIMGINDTSPMYPNLSWYDGFGKGKGGWFVKDVDAGAEWTALYLKHFYATTPGDVGDPLPKYWEVYNEPDMNFMNPQFGMIISSLEKNWEYHKLVAQKVREKLGSNAPKIGGMTWGQLDFFKPDGIPTRAPLTFWTQYLAADNPMLPVYNNMLSGVNGWPKAWDKRTDAWWQWDYLWQGFIDYAGADVDFYGVHIYDWPNATANQATTRSGGHTEAMLDQLEWYDTFKFGKKKEIVVSEFGAVSTTYINSLPSRRRDWEFLKPFNQMFMEILERPSQVVMSMPFAPTKAVWGAHIKDDGNVQRYDGATLFDPIGTWTGDKTTYKINEPSGGWAWSAIIYYFELWKGVDGTRIDTKSNNLDVQVDAYVNGKHVYVIVNNAEDAAKTVNLTTFNAATANTVSSVQMRHLYFDPTKGTQGEPTLSVANLTKAPAQVTLKPNSTIVLDYTYANTVDVNSESKETKYMSEPLTTAKNSRGTQLCRLVGKSEFTTTVNNVKKPAKGEAMVRIGGFFYNPADAGNGSINVVSLKINNKEVVTTSPMAVNPRGYTAGGYGGGWFGMLEIEIPIEYLNEGTNTVYFKRNQAADFTTVMIQVWDMNQDPGRTAKTPVNLTAISLGSDESLMKGNTLGIVPDFTPANASNKGLTWISSNTAVATVDVNGVVTAKADSGTAVITATSTQTGSIQATKNITAIPFKTSDVTGIAILEGANITVDQFVNTALTLQLTPKPINAPEIEWTSSNDANVSVLSTGKVVGKIIGSTAVITAKVKGTNISASITVTVRIAGMETVYTRELPDFIRPFTSGTVSVPVKIMGTRTVMMELLKDGTVIGSGSKDITVLGNGTVLVPYTIANAPAPGTTGYSIRLTLKNGSTILDTQSKVIEVKEHIRVSSITIQDGIALVQVGKTITRTASVLPADAYNTNIKWSSSNTAVATVDEATGVITGMTTGDVIIRATSADVITVFKEVTIKVQANEVAVPIVSIALPQSVNLFPGLKRTLTATLVPSYTTDTEVIWKSDNSLVTVDDKGVVTAGSIAGIATITATSKSNAAVFATCKVNVSKTIVIEAETFVATGGVDGVVKSATGFNNNVSGDWADYTVDVPSTGEYALKFNIGTPSTTGIGVNVYVDGVKVNTTTLAGTSSWDTNVIQNGSGSITVAAGIHTIRFESTGTQQWQWNADWFSIEYKGILSVGDKQISTIAVYPNPTYGAVVIEGLGDSSTISVLNMLGVTIQQINATGDRVDLNLGDLPSGIYLVRVAKEGRSDLFKIIKK